MGIYFPRPAGLVVVGNVVELIRLVWKFRAGSLFVNLALNVHSFLFEGKKN
jgi:hypothetical protein